MKLFSALSYLGQVRRRRRLGLAMLETYPLTVAGMAFVQHAIALAT